MANEDEPIAGDIEAWFRAFEAGSFYEGWLYMRQQALESLAARGRDVTPDQLRWDEVGRYIA